MDKKCGNLEWASCYAGRPGFACFGGDDRTRCSSPMGDITTVPLSFTILFPSLDGQNIDGERHVCTASLSTLSSIAGGHV